MDAKIPQSAVFFDRLFGDPVNLVVLGGLALGLLALVWFARSLNAQRADQAFANQALAERLEALTRHQSQLQASQEGRLSQLAASQEAAKAELGRTLEHRLDSLSQRLGEGLTKAAEKTGEQLGQLGERLAVIDAAQKNLTELSQQVVGLQDILANKQARGAFGEVQLADLVTTVLPPSAYDFQVSLSNGKRADCLIRLPNPPGPIVVDAKFPLEGYLALREAQDEAQRQQAVRALGTAVLGHVRDIAEKYIITGETAESALMFLPSEAVYAELHASLPDVVEKSYRARVWIVSPTTLMATLNTVRAVLKDARMREQAHVIQREVAAMADDVNRLDDRAGKLQRHFEQASEDLRGIRISTEKVVKRANRIEELELADEADPSATLNPPA
ncbi:MAG: DNA recombination protein RmuC [Rhodospirillales bacterium]